MQYLDLPAEIRHQILSVHFRPNGDEWLRDDGHVPRLVSRAFDNDLLAVLVQLEAETWNRALGRQRTRGWECRVVRYYLETGWDKTPIIRHLRLTGLQYLELVQSTGGSISEQYIWQAVTQLYFREQSWKNYSRISWLMSGKGIIIDPPDYHAEALALAAYLGNSEVLGLENNPENWFEETVLGPPILAATFGKQHALIWHLAAFGIHSSFRATPLMVAAKHGDATAVDILLECGADVDEKCADRTVLEQAVWRRVSPPCLERLIRKKVALSQDSQCYQARLLDEAIRYKSFELVSSLIDAGAYVNRLEENDPCAHIEAPMNTAARTWDRNIVALLLAAGANVNQVSKVSGLPPLLAMLTLDMAFGPGNPAGVIKNLVNNGSKVDWNLPDCPDPLQMTTALINPSIVRALIAAGADIDCPNRAFSAPLVCAFEQGLTHTIRLLLDAGASPDVYFSEWTLGQHPDYNWDIHEPMLLRKIWQESGKLYDPEDADGVKSWLRDHFAMIANLPPDSELLVPPR